MPYINNWRTGSDDDKLGLFQMEANLGFSAAVLEMLCYSKPEFVKLLPALPTAWKSGRIKGMLCRGGITVDIAGIISSEETKNEVIQKDEGSVSIQLSAAVPFQLYLLVK